MLSTLKLTLDDDTLDYRQSSLFQGVLFEHIDSDFVEKMHQQDLHPYSQYIARQNDKTVWVLNTLTDEAREEMIRPLFHGEVDTVTLKQKGNREVHIVGRSLTDIDRKTLMEGFYQAAPLKTIQIAFLTPTAFRQNGRYVILPDLRLIYQNLMMRYSASSSHLDMIDEDTLNEMVSDSYIHGYRLSSRAFPMEHRWIPGFTGNITIGFSGKSTVSQYIRLLLRFGEYSGIGIKTGMGMGAIQVMKENINERR